IFELVGVPPAGGGNALVAIGTLTDQVGFHANASTLEVVRRSGNVNMTAASVAYDPNGQRMLRLRQVGTSFVAETAAAAGGPYTMQAMLSANGINLASTSVRFGIGAFAAAGKPNDTGTWSTITIAK